MSLRKPTIEQKREQTPQRPPQGQFRRALPIFLILSLLLSGGLLVSCGTKTEPSPSSTAQPAETNSPALRPEFAKLPGKWVRPDGDYMLEIKNIEPSGKMDAGYFNPGPIRVSRAAALNDHGEIKVLVELRDENYPGCTYTLKYDPQSDQLYGQYYQAAMDQTFDVVFARFKEGATQ